MHTYSETVALCQENCLEIIRCEAGDNPGIIYMNNGDEYNPRFCSRHRSEATQTEAKRAVGAFLRRKHNHNYVEEQNRETSVAARICKP